MNSCYFLLYTIKPFVSTEMNVGTQEIRGSTHWEISAGKGVITRIGNAEFTLQHIRAAFVIDQPLDTRKKPKIQDLQLDMGNIQVRAFFLIFLKFHFFFFFFLVSQIWFSILDSK